MGNYTIFLKFENPRRGRQARNLSENDPKILDLKSSSEQIIFRKLSLGAPEFSTCKRIGPKCNVVPELKILGVPRLPPGGSLGTGKRGTVPKIWRAALIF